jgi:hypothetical protein
MNYLNLSTDLEEFSPIAINSYKSWTGYSYEVPYEPRGGEGYGEGVEVEDFYFDSEDIENDGYGEGSGFFEGSNIEPWVWI